MLRVGPDPSDGAHALHGRLLAASLRSRLDERGDTLARGIAVAHHTAKLAAIIGPASRRRAPSPSAAATSPTHPFFEPRSSTTHAPPRREPRVLARHPRVGEGECHHVDAVGPAAIAATRLAAAELDPLQPGQADPDATAGARSRRAGRC